MELIYEYISKCCLIKRLIRPVLNDKIMILWLTNDGYFVCIVAVLQLFLLYYYLEHYVTCKFRPRHYNQVYSQWITITSAKIMFWSSLFACFSFVCLSSSLPENCFLMRGGWKGVFWKNPLKFWVGSQGGYTIYVWLSLTLRYREFGPSRMISIHPKIQ